MADVNDRPAVTAEFRKACIYEYIGRRVAGEKASLVEYFAETGEIIANGQEHKGHAAIIEYYNNAQAPLDIPKMSKIKWTRKTDSFEITLTFLFFKSTITFTFEGDSISKFNQIVIA